MTRKRKLVYSFRETLGAVRDTAATAPGVNTKNLDDVCEMVVAHLSLAYSDGERSAKGRAIRAVRRSLEDKSVRAVAITAIQAIETGTWQATQEDWQLKKA